jgi:hypothetical protein
MQIDLAERAVAEYRKRRGTTPARVFEQGEQSCVALFFPFPPDLFSSNSPSNVVTGVVLVNPLRQTNCIS